MECHSDHSSRSAVRVRREFSRSLHILELSDRHDVQYYTLLLSHAAVFHAYKAGEKRKVSEIPRVEHCALRNRQHELDPRVRLRHIRLFLQVWRPAESQADHEPKSASLSILDSVLRQIHGLARVVHCAVTKQCDWYFVERSCRSFRHSVRGRAQKCGVNGERTWVIYSNK